MPLAPAAVLLRNDRLLTLLTSHLPKSLTLLRRLQTAARGIGTNPGARVLFITDDDTGVFTAAYADVVGQTFIFSSIQTVDHDHDGSAAQLAALLDALARLARETSSMLLASLSSDVRAVLELSGRLVPRPSGLFELWLLDVGCLPAVGEVLPGGMCWGRATMDDCVAVVSRSDIPRTPEFLHGLPSLVIKSEDETPVAWAFLGVDGSLISLHCEEHHRRNGLARKLAVKLLREGMDLLDGCGPWASAHVSVANKAAQALFRSLNGRPVSVVSCRHRRLYIVMSTFNGIVAEFPDIRIDYFRRHPTSPPPLACFLSHIHSDHLAGLESLRSPFVYCSAATREMLLRLERYPCRINYAKGILEARQQTYSHLARILKPLPLETPTIMELRPGRTIRVTLFDANHCPGSVMFLIEGSGKSILYTGDVRCEPDFISGLRRSPVLIEYCYGIRTLDTLYLDTSFIADVPFPPKAAGIGELICAVSQYPDDTVFHIRAWTYGYEDVWIALARALNSPIHVDDYKLRVYGALRARADHHLAAGAAALTGHMCGNTPYPGCLTSDTGVRLHSCEKGNMCAVATGPSVVSIQPIVTRLANGEALAEQGVGGGGDDLEREAELAFSLQENDAAALMDLWVCIRPSDSLDEAQREGLKKAINDVRDKGRELSLNVAASSLDKGDQARIQNALSRLISDGKHAETGDDGETVGGLPRVIRFPYSRHSSYPELCELVDLFTPHDVWPCTVNVERWKAQGLCRFVRIENLFGIFCSGEKAYAHDQMMAERERTASEMERDDDDSQQTSISIASSRHPVSRNEAFIRMRANVSSDDDDWRPIPLLSTDGGHDVAEQEL
ncbi:hypothetical protein CDD80_5915 [Ophiocordyceps camponoti-rufipedis]|uniref:N-acetyltransferase domain-containing protein n=1 Tax=Ophiocordyceps camponoti-rufipedis TaxID=2004952 RepID=A0A2C5ZHS4_9HYPO|nr:hypothetical protein CDD80_5915 [Ophiocordyceps camponoti-rufipedis]